MLGGVIGDLDPSTGGGGVVTPPSGPTGPTPVVPYSADPVVQANLVTRFQFLIPNGWFHSAVRDAFLWGAANALTLVYSLLQYVKLQTRIQTATDGSLDMIAGDFFGAKLMRSGRSDASFLALINANLLRRRNTRAAVISVLTQLTGRAPLVFEPANVRDTGAYGGPGLGYGVAGGYGSYALPFQSFVTAFRPVNGTAQNVAGYGSPVGGYGVGRIEYSSLAAIAGAISDQDIFDAADSVRPIANQLWMRIAA